MRLFLKLFWLLLAGVCLTLLLRMALRPSGAGQPEGPHAAGPSAEEKRPASPHAVSSSTGKLSRVGGSLRPVCFPQRGQINVEDLDPAIILDQRITDPGDGTIRRLFLVNGGGSYPYHRIEELLRYDAATGRYIVEHQIMAVADHLLVALRPGQTQEALEALNTRFGATITKFLKFANEYIVRLPECSLDGVPDAIAAYEKETNLIERAHEDLIHAPTAIPNDTNWGSQWDKQRIDCPEAWDTETGSTNIIIAIIDTGVDLDHPDLAGRIWRNPGEAGALASNGIDDDGNGYVDDWIGYDFGRDDNDPDDNGDADYDGRFSEAGHGTHCAGIAGAVGNNSTQVAGVCWNVTIMALKPFEYMAGDGDMRVYSSKATEAMEYAANMGAKVTSNSYGGPGDGSTYYGGVSYLNSRGVLFVASAGNDGQNNDVLAHQPSNIDLPNVIAVANSTSSDFLSPSSNYGAAKVHLAAPGTSILSTMAGGSTDTKSGTSMAAPQVAGALGLLYSYSPDIPYLECKQAILDGVDRLPAYAGKCVSEGRLNVGRSLELLQFTREPVHQYPYGQSFENNFGHWTHDEGSIEWIRYTGGTPSTGTGPSGASDGTYYVYTESSGVYNKTGLLKAVFDFSSLTAPEIGFSYHMYGTSAGSLYLEASTNGTAWSALWSAAGNQGDQWLSTRVSLQEYGGLTNVAIRFRSLISGFAGMGDTAIDDIHVTEGDPVADGDLDDDGLPDEWEILYFGGPEHAAPEDAAANGINTVREAYVAGLDPTDPDAAFRVSVQCTPSSGAVLKWNAVTGRVYSVYGTTRLPETFQPLATNMVFPQASWTDAVHQAGRVYRMDVRLKNQ